MTSEREKEATSMESNGIRCAGWTRGSQGDVRRFSSIDSTSSILSGLVRVQETSRKPSSGFLDEANRLRAPFDVAFEEAEAEEL